MINFPVLKQTPSMCGPFSIKMVLAYYGMDKSVDELIPLVKATTNFGCTQHDLAEGIRSLGLEVDHKTNSSLEEIKTYLE